MKRQQGLSTLGSVVLAGCGGFIVTVMMMSWVVVDVDTADGVHLKVPVPLMALRCAAGCIPIDEMEIPELPDELRQNKEAMLMVLRELRDCPDAMLVDVVTPDATVTIAKSGDDVLVDVEADDATVHVSVPVRRMTRVLERWDWQHVEPKLAFDLLAAGRGELVNVQAEDASVRVTVW